LPAATAKSTSFRCRFDRLGDPQAPKAVAGQLVNRRGDPPL
jgi:hypothetical protein